MQLNCGEGRTLPGTLGKEVVVWGGVVGLDGGFLLCLSSVCLDSFHGVLLLCLDLTY